MNLNIVAGAMGMIWMGCSVGIPLTMLMESLGASGTTIGLCATVQQLAMAVQIPGALFAARLPTRKRFWMSLTLVHRLLWFMPPILLLTFGAAGQTHVVVWAMVGIVSLSAVFANAGTASWWSWMSDLIPEGKSGSFWGRRQSVVMTSFLVTLALTGWVLDAFKTSADGHPSYLGFILVFAAGSVFGAADILLFALVPEPPQQPAVSGMPLMKRILEPLRDANFRWLTMSTSIWALSLGIVGSFTIVYLKQVYHATYTHIAIVTISGSIGTIVAGMLWGYVIDRVGARAFGAIMLVVGPACGLSWFFTHPSPITLHLPYFGTSVVPQPVVMISLVNLVAGALYSGIGLSQISLASSLAPKHAKTMSMAVHWTIVGLMGALGPLIGGAIMDGFITLQSNVTFGPLLRSYHDIEMPAGDHPGFFQILMLLHVATSWFIAMPLLLKVRPPRGSQLPVGAALGRLLAGNPLRLVSNIYNIYAIGSPTTPETRAQAARALGESRTQIAVDDLIQRLDDPSADVREEAVFALGSIGSPEAIQALIAKLEDANNDLAPQIARALRQAPDREVVASHTVDVLVRQLDSGDRETQSETARTLGALGDPRAAAELLDLISQTTDTKVLGATSEALARLGQIAAIYQILPHMKETRNPVLKRSLAVAIGDLLGEPDGFYKVLLREEQNRCSEVARLMKEFRAALRKALPKTLETEAVHLDQLTRQLLDAYEADELQRCADLLFDLAIGLSAALHGAVYGGHSKAFISDLVWRDQRFGIGVWFLDILRERWDEHQLGTRDHVDILLGIYFIASQRNSLEIRAAITGDDAVGGFSAPYATDTFPVTEPGPGLPDAPVKGTAAPPATLPPKSALPPPGDFPDITTPKA